MLQVCAACHKTKPAEEFPRKKMATDGLHSYCRACYTDRERKRKQKLRVPGPAVDHKVGDAGVQVLE